MDNLRSDEIFENNDNNNKLQKQSNFSIEHILKHAGEKFENKKYFDRINEESQDHFHQIQNSNSSVVIPMFDWLQYTRYRPPKIPRALRSGPIKRTPGRLPRVPFTPSQLTALENAYKISTYLSSEDANKLAQQLNLTSTRVKIWFQNRRARERREKREQDEKFCLSSSPSPERELFVVPSY